MLSFIMSYYVIQSSILAVHVTIHVSKIMPQQVHIGSVHPERDFERWLGERRTGGAVVWLLLSRSIALRLGLGGRVHTHIPGLYFLHCV